MAVKLYISQANQAHNAGPRGYTEKEGMVAISKELVNIFKRDGRFLVLRNVAANRVDTAASNCDDANRWGADYYLALHSNAGGKGARGTIGFYHNKASKGYKLADKVSREVGKISPGGFKGLVEKPGFIEVHRPNAPAALIELEAHDYLVGVKFLQDKKVQIAWAIYRGVCEAVGLTPKKPKPVVKPTPKPVPVPEPAPVPDYRPLKKAAVKLAEELGIVYAGIGVNSNQKGLSIEKLLRDIAQYGNPEVPALVIDVQPVLDALDNLNAAVEGLRNPPTG